MNWPRSVASERLMATDRATLSERESWSRPARPGKRLRLQDESTTWSRSGCITCKKRRKKCDEAKPSCRNCLNLGRHCEGYATVWTAPLSVSTETFRQNQSPRKRRRTNSTTTTSGPPSVVEDGNDLVSSGCPSEGSPGTSVISRSGDGSDIDGALWANDGDTSTPATTPVTQQYPELELIRSPPSNLASRDLLFVQYHAECGFRLLSNLETQHNPLKELLVPRALSSPLLRNALCTLAAAHMTNWESGDRDSLMTAEVKYYGQTLSGLRTALAHLPSETALKRSDMASVEELIVTIAWILKYEVVRGSVKEWRGHLEALQRLVISCGGLSALNCDIADWLSGLITYFQHMAKLTNPRRDTSVLICDGIYNTPKVDIYLGCSESLVKICSQISDLPRLTNYNSLAQEVTTISQTLTDWSFDEQSFIVPEGIDAAAFGRLRMVASCFRYAAFIFLHSILDRLAQKEEQRHLRNVEPSQGFTALHSLIFLTKSEALRQILVLIESSSPLDGNCEYSALAFPLFVTGCECQGRDQLVLILRSLHSLEQNFGVQNTRRAQELLTRLSRSPSWPSSSSKQPSNAGESTPKQHWLDVLEEMDWDLIMV